MLSHGPRQVAAWLIFDVGVKLRIAGQILVLVALIATATASLWEDSASRPVRLIFWGLVMLVWVAAVSISVALKRRAGRSWNEALSDGSKLMTGSVWLDGILFAGILLVLCVAIFALVMWT